MTSSTETLEFTLQGRGNACATKAIATRWMKQCLCHQPLAWEYRQEWHGYLVYYIDD